MAIRRPVEIIAARPSSDGDGVKLLRVFGGSRPQRFDPFLMLDEFGSAEASDYIGGFPPHPHRGFETITYMLQGKMEHRDHMDNVGLLNDGDVQWMTAGRGIIHSEMPRQTEGVMRGFQLWLNLPSESKLSPASYTDLPSAQLPVYDLPGGRIVAIAGDATVNGTLDVKGYFDRPRTRPLLWDLQLDSASDVSIAVPATFTVMAYVFEGQVEIAGTPVNVRHLARLDDGDEIALVNRTSDNSRLLIIAGEPLKEPIVQYGPFVMNRPEEIEQAIQDYRAGTLTGSDL